MQKTHLKVIMDEIFGRTKFVANIVWQKRTSRENRKVIGSAHDHILVYAPLGPQGWKEFRNLLPDADKGYANPDKDPKGRWRSIPFSAQGYRKNQMYKITTPTGVEHDPPKGRCWGATEDEYNRLLSEGRVYFPKKGNGKPRIKQYDWEETGLVPMSWWPASLAGTNDQAKKEILELFPDEKRPFDTPKPEKLIENILHIATNKDELVLDSFLGSGTTAAVAHKMGRRYIGVEMGEHAVTHCQPRLKKVIEGEQGGVSQGLGWKGGGGFHFYKLGAPIFDANGHINPEIKFPHLAAHIWFSETRTALARKAKTPFLGVHNGTAYYLLYNGILGDKTLDGGNVLTSKLLKELHHHNGPKIIYGESSRLGSARLKAANIVFKQTPYDVKAR